MSEQVSHPAGFRAQAQNTNSHRQVALFRLRSATRRSSSVSTSASVSVTMLWLSRRGSAARMIAATDTPRSASEIFASAGTPGVVHGTRIVLMKRNQPARSHRAGELR